MNCTAPWSGASFEVSLLVEGDCEFIQTFGVPVTYNVRPTVTVTPEDDDDFICSTDDTAVYTFRVTSDVIAPEPNNQITVTITDDADSACTFTGTTETSGLGVCQTAACGDTATRLPLPSAHGCDLLALGMDLQRSKWLQPADSAYSACQTFLLSDVRTSSHSLTCRACCVLIYLPLLSLQLSTTQWCQ